MSQPAVGAVLAAEARTCSASARAMAKILRFSTMGMSRQLEIQAKPAEARQ